MSALTALLVNNLLQCLAHVVDVGVEHRDGMEPPPAAPGFLVDFFQHALDLIVLLLVGVDDQRAGIPVPRHIHFVFRLRTPHGERLIDGVDHRIQIGVADLVYFHEPTDSLFGFDVQFRDQLHDRRHFLLGAGNDQRVRIGIGDHADRHFAAPAAGLGLIQILPHNVPDVHGTRFRNLIVFDNLLLPRADIHLLDNRADPLEIPFVGGHDD